MMKIQNYAKNKITVLELQDLLKIEDYQSFAQEVTRLVLEAQIVPIKSSGGNGKKPVLYHAYKIIKNHGDKEALLEEMKYLAPELIMDFYRNNLQKYADDRNEILQLNQYLLKNRDKLKYEVSVNERSFEIFFREKFLLNGGLQLLNRLGLNLSDLNCYQTSQPLAYYSHSKKAGQNILFIENKDTFFTLRKHLLEGGRTILGLEFGTLIYGGGKSIYRSLDDFNLAVEPYMNSKQNQFFYFGDMDYEGILIYEKVSMIMEDRFPVRPFIPAYLSMMDKALESELPKSKEAQNKNTGGIFFQFFDEEQRRKMQQILSDGKYIPQEIVQKSDL